jgi:hypothetical protein
MTVVELHLEHRVGERFDDLSLQGDAFFLAFRQVVLLRTALLC